MSVFGSLKWSNLRILLIVKKFSKFRDSPGIFHSKIPRTLQKVILRK